MSATLVDRLIAAAAEAIANERPDLERESERLRGIVLELSVNSAGVVVDGTCYVERRLKSARGSAP